ncbi:hypothetical protein PR048_030566 [Dryococelus australis]|uniref:Uncharacterized protein n=1 Tax=Dryococelus australis TaxID=614101 RepID=A0ABQ9G9C2_9NEOP|nr:hypothetical protein PR048_030566 [Dryococelus australis]
MSHGEALREIGTSSGKSGDVATVPTTADLSHVVEEIEYFPLGRHPYRGFGGLQAEIGSAIGSRGEKWTGAAARGHEQGDRRQPQIRRPSEEPVIGAVVAPMSINLSRSTDGSRTSSPCYTEIPEKTRRPTVSSGTITTFENPVTRRCSPPALPGGEHANHSANAARQSRGDVVARLLASHLGELGSNPGGIAPGLFARGSRVERRRWSAGFLGGLLFSRPLRSNAAPHLPYFTFIGSPTLHSRNSIP